MLSLRQRGNATGEPLGRFRAGSLFDAGRRRSPRRFAAYSAALVRSRVAARLENARSRRAPSGSYEVLIVEDEPDFRHLFELHLRSWGLPIHLQCVPSGFDALLAIGAISELEIMVVTALTEHTIAERGGLPADVTVLFKPLRFGELRQRLGQLLEHWQRAEAG